MPLKPKQAAKVPVVETEKQESAKDSRLLTVYEERQQQLLEAEQELLDLARSRRKSAKFD